MRSDIYDRPALYDHEYEDWCDDVIFYEQVVHELLGGPGELLELACGSGRLTRRLVADGHCVFACDLSADMLRRAEALDTGDGPGRAHFFRTDMRSFALGRRIPLVVCCFNALEHLHEDADFLACLRAVREVIALDGFLVFDVQNPNPRVLGYSRKKIWGRRTFRGPGGGWIKRSLTSEYHRKDQIHDVTARYQPLAEDKKTPSGPAFSQKVLQRMFFPKELQTLVEAAGFRVRMRLGEFNHSVFEDDSPSQILFCQPTVRAAG